jgi:hypothetical protein
MKNGAQNKGNNPQAIKKNNVPLQLTLPPEAVERLSKAGIRCTPEVTLEYQRAAGRYVLRARESGGAVKEMGRYVGYCGDRGERLPWFVRPDSVVSNGDHAIVIAPALVSIEVFRFERTYELLIARHTIGEAQARRRAPVTTQVVFRGWQGQLPLDLIDRDKALAGKIAPEFFTRAGEPRQIPAQYVEAVQCVVRGANCQQCTHCHLLVPKPAAAAPATAAIAAGAATTAARETTLTGSDVSTQGQPDSVTAEVA